MERAARSRICHTAVFAALASLVLVLPGHAAPPDVSSNWAGYVLTGPGSTSNTASPRMSYTDVTGQWVQPKAVCKGGVASSLAIWVGLGGYSLSSKALEQIGTEADCDAQGRPTYSIWYELVPADPVSLHLRIDPGDTIAAVVKVNRHAVLVQVTDRTRGRRFTRHLTMSRLDLTSAEWVIEAPSLCDDEGFCKQAALTRFGSISFAHTYATGNGVGGTITSPGWMSSAIELVPRSRRFFGDRNDPGAAAGRWGAAPADLLADGTGFTVSWRANP